MCLEVPHQQVIALVDMTRAIHTVPANIFTTVKARYRGKADNFDRVVVVSNSTLIKVFVGTINRLPALENQFAFFVSREAALSFIHHRWAQHETV